MKSDYWNVSNEQVLEITGQHIQHWMKLLDEFDAANKKSNDVVAFLQQLNVPRYWARTLTTFYLKQKEG